MSKRITALILSIIIIASMRLVSFADKKSVLLNEQRSSVSGVDIALTAKKENQDLIVAVNIDNAYGITTYKYELVYDSAVLRVIDVDKGDSDNYWPEGADRPFNDTGKEIIISSYWYDQLNSPKATINTIRFEIINNNASETTLTIQNPTFSFESYRTSARSVKGVTVNLKETGKESSSNQSDIAYKLGDVDNDGQITSADARLALRASVKLENYKKETRPYLAADVDQDLSITSADARLILRISVKLEPMPDTVPKPDVPTNQEEHNWQDATCTQPKTCKHCGMTIGVALGHKWRDATCTQPKTCTRCGLTEGVAPGHQWNGGEISGNQTIYTCKVCGVQRSETTKNRSAEENLKQFIVQHGTYEDSSYHYQKKNGDYYYRINYDSNSSSPITFQLLTSRSSGTTYVITLGYSEGLRNPLCLFSIIANGSEQLAVFYSVTPSRFTKYDYSSGLTQLEYEGLANSMLLTNAKELAGSMVELLVSQVQLIFLDNNIDFSIRDDLGFINL